MNLYLLKSNAAFDWDTYDSAVVAAPDEAEAVRVHPDPDREKPREFKDYTWPYLQENMVEVTLIGKAKPGTKRGVICASFNAG